MNRPDVLNELTNQQLVERYRLDRAGIQFITDLLQQRIQPATNRHNSVSAIEKVLITLRYLATDGIQLNDGDLHHVSQPCISNVVKEVTDALSSPDIVSTFIRFPRTIPELDNQCEQFFAIAHFPRVVAVIDGTHIKIKAPSIDEDAYVNRKNFHSINVQIVFDASDKIVNIVAQWPGSTHDSRILQNSRLFTMFEEGQIGNYHILGDSGYGCRRWLLTPYLAPQPGSQTAYNRSHKITRAKVERGIGQLKRRFSILHGEIRMRPEKACKIVLACAVLHNICKQRQIVFPDLELDVQVDDNDEHLNHEQHIPQQGLRYRDYIANTHF